MTGIMITKRGEQQQTVNNKNVITLQGLLTARVVIKKSLNDGTMNYKNLYIWAGLFKARLS